MNRSFLTATGLVLALTACGPDVRPEPSATSSGRAATTASAAPSASATPSSAAPAASSDADRKAELERKLLRELGGDADLTDTETPGAPLAAEDANLGALLAGGQALTSLPTRSTDRGQSFDRDLPERLKPPAPTKMGRPAPKCPPGDPLCSD